MAGLLESPRDQKGARAGLTWGGRAKGHRFPSSQSFERGSTRRGVQCLRSHVSVSTIRKTLPHSDDGLLLFIFSLISGVK